MNILAAIAFTQIAQNLRKSISENCHIREIRYLPHIMLQKNRLFPLRGQK
jgi:hypothetical protein